LSKKNRKINDEFCVENLSLVYNKIMNSNKKADILTRTRTAIMHCFGEYISEDPSRARQIIEEATYTGEEDPGGWSQSAPVIIHCESGIPNGMYDGLYERWFAVSDILGDHFCEHINAAVIAVYPV